MKIFKVLRGLKRVVASAPFAFLFFSCEEPKTRGVGSRKSCTIGQMRLRLWLLLLALAAYCGGKNGWFRYGKCAGTSPSNFQHPTGQAGGQCWRPPSLFCLRAFQVPSLPLDFQFLASKVHTD